MIDENSVYIEDSHRLEDNNNALNLSNQNLHYGERKIDTTVILNLPTDSIIKKVSD